MASPTPWPNTNTSATVTVPKAKVRTAQSLISIQPRLAACSVTADYADTQQTLRWALTIACHDQIPDDPAYEDRNHDEETVQDESGETATPASKPHFIVGHVISYLGLTLDVYTSSPSSSI